MLQIRLRPVLAGILPAHRAGETPALPVWDILESVLEAT